MFGCSLLASSRFLQKSGSSHHDVLCMEVKATSECVTGTCSFTHLLVLQYVVS